MGENSKMRNLLTYFPVEPTRAYPVPRPWPVMLTTLTQIGLSAPKQNLQHLLHKWAYHFKPIFAKQETAACTLLPKRVLFLENFPPNQKIVVHSKQSKQWWWVTMYNQKHAWDEQLPVVSTVSVHCFPKYCLYYCGGGGRWIKRIKLYKMNMGHSPPLSAVPPIFHLQLISPICLFGELFQVRILWSAISPSAPFTSKHLLHVS